METASAAATALPAQPAPFQNGDTVVFLGDSITHGRKWHRYIADFYNTHLPERAIQYVNAGISGDTTQGALERLDRDVLRYHPQVVVVLLGMNDVVGREYPDHVATAEQLRARERDLVVFHDRMQTLVKRLQDAHVRDIILISPTPYDNTTALKLPNNQIGKNYGLELASRIVRNLAFETHSAYIDFYGPLNEINREQQLTNPDFSLTPVDRVHPDPPGNLLMAWLFLHAQGVTEPPPITIHPDGSVSCQGCSVANLERHSGTVSFDLSLDRLPVGFDDDTLPALRLAPIEQDWSTQRLRVDDVAPDQRYTVLCDGTPIGSFNALALQLGVNLDAPSSPLYLQAREVAEADEQWRELATSLRDVEKVRNTILIPAGKQNGSAAQIASFLSGWLTKKQESDPAGSVYYSIVIPKALATMPKVAQIQAEIPTLQRKAQELGRGRAHRIEVRLLPRSD